MGELGETTVVSDVVVEGIWLMVGMHEQEEQDKMRSEVGCIHYLEDIESDNTKGELIERSYLMKFLVKESLESQDFPGLGPQ